MVTYATKTEVAPEHMEYGGPKAKGIALKINVEK